MTGGEGCSPLCPWAWFTLGREGTFAGEGALEAVDGLEQLRDPLFDWVRMLTKG
jgi:hypothetical protein